MAMVIVWTTAHGDSNGFSRIGLSQVIDITILVAATVTPANGVHNPSNNSDPLTNRTNPAIKFLGSDPDREKYSPLSAKAATAMRALSRSKPMAGHPLGNVQNRRCRAVSFTSPV